MQILLAAAKVDKISDNKYRSIKKSGNIIVKILVKSKI